jgi:hypothetical protein
MVSQTEIEAIKTKIVEQECEIRKVNENCDYWADRCAQVEAENKVLRARLRVLEGENVSG